MRRAGGRGGKVAPERNEAEKEKGKAFAEEGGKTPSAGEFLSGFWVEDRQVPSITVTVFFGSEAWDGPLSLFEMMDVSDTEVLACMDSKKPDYDTPDKGSRVGCVMLGVFYCSEKGQVIWRKRRVAAYARVSIDHEEQSDIPS